MSFFRHPVVIAFVGAMLFGISLSLRVDAMSPIKGEDEVPSTTPPAVSLRERADARALQEEFRTLPLEATAVVVWDVQASRVLFGKNETAQLPLASLTKAMLAYSANEVLTDDDIVTVTGKDLAEEGSSGIMAGDRFRYADLRSATLVASLNDGANAISRTMGEYLKKNETPSQQKEAAVETMNTLARALGLEQSYFYNEDGLDLGAGQPGAIGSAKDVAKIFSALARQYRKTLSPTTEGGLVLRSRTGSEYQYWNTNQHLEDVPGIIGSKTGYTALADGNLAVVFEREGQIFVVVILGSSKEGRFTDVAKVVHFLNSHPISKITDAGGIIESIL